MRKDKSSGWGRPTGGRGSSPSAPQEPPNALSSALRMLSRRPYAIAELRRALENKSFQAEQIDEAMRRLRELGYLDDRKFAEQYAYSLAQNRAFGPHRLRRELKVKRVDAQEIDKAVEHAYKETTASELLERALDKKVRSIRLPLTRAKFHSLCQGLMRRGFSSGDIIKAVRARPELAPVAEEIEPVDLDASGHEPEPEHS